MARIAINGFGRIGRGFLRAAHGLPGLEIVAINDLTSADNLAYLLKYDSVYRRAAFPVSSQEHALVVDGVIIPVLAERDPAKLPWKDMHVDIVVESTGFFTEGSKAQAHIDAGAKKVVISAPGKGAGVETILIGANEEKFDTCTISSNASCTTNAANPIIGILDQVIGIEKAILSTTHAYTASQSLVDSPSAKDMKEGRAAALNIVPTSTGAAIATTLAYPQLAGKFDGISLRVPVPAGSIVDVTFIAKRATTVEEVNNALKAAAETDQWKRVFAVSEEPLVSSDILGLPYGSIADLDMTRVVDGTLVKVLAWYDNEMGYVHTLVEHVSEIAKRVS
ncbi:MAG: glyceraldehyde-3-phosphate dehydrogenase [Candidatus Kaiserbacteria bacterium]|nr:glyceraldehyde-3-phosphate dehydrogenase [Candidatus Kaiserbacteria bacterium]